MRGDIILAIAGIEFGPGAVILKRIRERLEQARSGDALPVKILRAGKVLEITARVP